jgi:hypothetical protein
MTKRKLNTKWKPSKLGRHKNVPRTKYFNHYDLRILKTEAYTTLENNFYSPADLQLHCVNYKICIESPCIYMTFETQWRSSIYSIQKWFSVQFLHSFPRNRRSPISAGYSQKPASSTHIFMFELGMPNLTLKWAANRFPKKFYSRQM